MKAAASAKVLKKTLFGSVMAMLKYELPTWELTCMKLIRKRKDADMNDNPYSRPFIVR